MTEFSPEEIERQLRMEWWLNHGHGYSALYGDDGEMQCGACPADFKRMPLATLRDYVLVGRARRRQDAWDAMQDTSKEGTAASE